LPKLLTSLHVATFSTDHGVDQFLPTQHTHHTDEELGARWPTDIRSLRFVRESRWRTSWFGHSVQCRMAHACCELLRYSVMAVLDGKVKGSLTLIVLLVDQCTTSVSQSQS